MNLAPQNIEAAIFAAGLGLLVGFVYGCGAQGSTMAPSYIGEGQGIASQLMGMVSQVQSYQNQQQMMELQRQQLQRQQQQQWGGNP